MYQQTDDRMTTPPSGRDAVKNGSGMLVTIAQTLEVWLHINRGEERILRRAIGGFLLMFLYCIVYKLVFPRMDLRPMLLFAAWTTLLSGAHWIIALWRRWRHQPQPHTRYSGTPILMRWIPLNEMPLKWLEPPLVLAIAFAVRLADRPLGIWLMVASGACLILVIRDERIERRRTLELHNSIIEQTSRSQRFGRMRQ